MLKDLIDLPFRLLLVATVMAAGYLAPVTLIFFPRDVGLVELPPVEESIAAKNYYDAIYNGQAPDHERAETSDHGYVVINRAAAQDAGIEGTLKAFVDEFGLRDARTLEVGAGSGSLQDVVEDYTGLDIAESAARYFHKPFVQGSATDLPFEDSSFDLAWTVWTLEHVPDPEKAMLELRRVVKPGGMIFFYPAFNCVPWAATGHEVRPYESLALTEKIAKASLAVRANPLFIMSHLAPIRLLRYGYWRYSGEPTRLRYTAIAPNYTHYWAADADATVSMDAGESMLWFISRGDECVNCPTSLAKIATMQRDPLFIKVRK